MHWLDCDSEKLTQRPTKLHIYPVETYPGTRLLTESISQKEHEKIINDMPQMVGLVYDMYMEKIKSLPQPEEAAELQVI